MDKLFQGFTPDQCFIPEWLQVDKNGHHLLSEFRNRKSKAHRAAYQLFIGRIPPHRHVLRTCDNVRCANPYHLYLGDASQNSKRVMCKIERAGGKGVVRGESNLQSKLTAEAVRDIRKGEYTGKYYAKKYGVTSSTVSSAKNRRTWREIE